MPNDLRFEPLVLGNVISPDIRARAESAMGLRTSQYLAYEDNEEVGFLSVDRFPETDSLDICAIFVFTAQRDKGFGTGLLARAEKLAREEGFRCVKLNAAPDDDISKSKLIEWYIKRGYQRNPDIDDDLALRMRIP
jgi:ribosomal protein S18 acetylase RimI-like enzyme